MFTDDIGKYEEAADMGDRAMDFFTLITEWLLDYQILFGEHATKFQSIKVTWRFTIQFRKTAREFGVMTRGPMKIQKIPTRGVTRTLIGEFISIYSVLLY